MRRLCQYFVKSTNHVAHRHVIISILHFLLAHTRCSPQHFHLKPCPFSWGQKWSCQSKTARKISFLYEKRAKLTYMYKNVNLGQINYLTRPNASLALRSVYCYRPCLQARALRKRNKQSGTKNSEFLHSLYILNSDFSLSP